ncbi:MAG: hypothetical protein M0T80_10730 [Actinomycetota bacterium]|nr:hypothetical protein [Actinomycetota bacterium]
MSPLQGPAPRPERRPACLRSLGQRHAAEGLVTGRREGPVPCPAVARELRRAGLVPVAPAPVALGRRDQLGDVP